MTLTHRSTRRWQQLQPGTRRWLIALGAVDGALKVAALADLARRPADEVRGPKRHWALALGLLNSAGLLPLAYFMRGRQVPESAPLTPASPIHGPNRHATDLDHQAWDDRYGEDQMWSGQPNEALVREVADQTPGTALDVGCGEGADAIWLAGQGWSVDAIDVSLKALTRGERAAAALTTDVRGVDVTWRRLGLEDLPNDTAYDLVSVCYPALVRGDGTIIDTLLDAVAEGGTLLVVHHAHIDRERACAHGFDPDDLVRHEDILAALGPAEWTIEEAGEHERTAPDGPGAHHTVDLILRASRKISA